MRGSGAVAGGVNEGNWAEGFHFKYFKYAQLGENWKNSILNGYFSVISKLGILKILNNA